MSTTKLHKDLMEKPLEVYEIFKDFFGEYLVDLQDFPDLDLNEPVLISESNYKGHIIIRFPKVRVTNEYDKYVDIKELYVKININHTGCLCGGFRMNRAHYPISHLYSNYLHSHISGIPFSNSREFLSPCLGSGPIRDTINHLNTSFDESLWKLFCLELDKYVHTESIEGVPYNRLENIGSRGSSSLIDLEQYSLVINTRNSNIIKDFINNIPLEDFTFAYINGAWRLAMSHRDFLITISNLFIKYINDNEAHRHIYIYDTLLNNNVIKKVRIIGNSILYSNNQGYNNNYESFENSVICTFKGEEVRVVIDRNLPEETNECHILNIQIVGSIYKNILNIVNYRYGNSNYNTTTN